MSIALKNSTGERARRCRGWAHVSNVAALFLLLCVPLLAGPASAQFRDSESDAPDDARTVKASPDPVRFLPGAVAAASGSPATVGFGWAGYDGATRDPLLGASAETRLGSRLVIGVGVTYAAATSLQPSAARPSVVARVQILDQRSHGLDASLAFGFRQDRFVEEDGFFQASVASGWQSDHATFLANLGYGQDGEGDDHVGEIRAAALYRLHQRMHLGFDGHLRKLLNSTDPQLALHGTPAWEFAAGPVAALTVGSWVFLVETGASGVRRGTLKAGAIAVGGVGAVF